MLVLQETSIDAATNVEVKFVLGVTGDWWVLQFADGYPVSAFGGSSYCF